jgi:hypothetical protein
MALGPMFSPVPASAWSSGRDALQADEVDIVAPGEPGDDEAAGDACADDDHARLAHPLRPPARR